MKTEACLMLRSAGARPGTLAEEGRFMELHCSPFQQAAKVYESEPCAHTFEEDFAFHLEHGYIHSSPSFFAMARPVKACSHHSMIAGHFVFNGMDCDCWHIWLLAGNFNLSWLALPFDLPLISFERKNVLKFARLDRMRGISKLLAK